MHAQANSETGFRAHFVGLCALGAALCAPVRGQSPALSLVPPPPETLAGSCDTNWSESFGRLSGMDASVYGITVFDDGRGPALYAGGSFTNVGGVPANRVARWDGKSWSALAGGIGDGLVSALAVFDDGNGPALYAGGSFGSAGPGPASRIAKWNGTQWSALGGGLSGGQVSVLCVFDDGSGNALYAGGSFGTADGTPVERIARWNGSSWSALAGSWPSGSPLAIQSLCVFDDGSGAALYAGGMLRVQGSAPASFVARWTGSGWTLLTSPFDSGETVLALVAGDIGGGPALYAGGDFLTIAGVPANCVARWDGTSWCALGSGVNSLFEPPLKSLAICDDGSGPALIAGGRFSTAGGLAASNLARWDGAQWNALDGGVDGGVYALVGNTYDSAPSLYAGGTFSGAGGYPSAGIAEWGLPPGCSRQDAIVCEPGSGGTSACPCANPPASAGRGCDNSAATGGARLTSSGSASLANDSLVLTTSGEKPNATSIVLQGRVLDSLGAPFGQGVRCIGGPLLRLYVRNAVGGAIHVPGPGDPSLCARSALLGDTIVQGSQRYYGVFYRDPIVLGGCTAASTFNITQQLAVVWQP